MTKYQTLKIFTFVFVTLIPRNISLLKKKDFAIFFKMNVICLSSINK